ncbi:MAG: hypothetical protein KF744_08975 [Taibaiella sp.]|nr:hypothetical protein [Taibaiella sp.]
MFRFLSRTLLVLCFSVAAHVATGQTYVIDSTTHNNSTASLTNQSNAFNSLNASAIVFAVTDYTVATIGSMTDDQGNTYTNLLSVSNGTYRVTFWGAKARHTAAATRATYTTAAFAYSTIHGITLGNVDTSGASFVDQTNGSATGFGFVKQPGSITPTMNNSMVLTAVNSAGAGGAASPPTVSSPYIITGASDYLAGAHFSGGMAQYIQGTAAATNPTWTGVNNNQYAAIIMNVKPYTAPAATGNGAMMMWFFGNR